MSTAASSKDENPAVPVVAAKAFSGASGTTRRAALGDLTNAGPGPAAAAAAAAPAKRSSRPSHAGAGAAPAPVRSVSSASVASESVASSRRASAASSSVAAAAADSGSSLERAIAAVKASDKANPNRVGDYVNAIMSHLFAREGASAPSATYMSRQTDITPKMRCILIDWLVEVHLKYKLIPETLYLTINIIDRFLDQRPLMRTKLQLLGVTAMLIASKYEEVYSPEIRDFVFITDNAYSQSEIIHMECMVLEALQFKVTVATPYPFLQRLCKVSGCDSRTTYLAHYFLERSLQEISMLAHLPSAVAASAMYLALKSTKRAGSSSPTWTPVLAHFSGYTTTALHSCITELHSIVSSASSAQQQAVRKKYSSAKYQEVARLPLATV